MIETLSEVLSQPGVRKALDSPLVIKQIDRFKSFLSSIILKALNKWTLTLKKYLKWSNLILINLVVLSYQAGKVDAATLSEWWKVISSFDVWWDYQIIINLVYVGGRFLRRAIVICLKVAFIVLFLWLLYKFFLWVSDQFSSFFKEDKQKGKQEAEIPQLEEPKKIHMITPKPYCSNTDNIKAFVLGCDPTAFDKTGNRLEFEYVFDLGNDDRYFSGVIDNLEQISLSIEKVYVQNLVTDYQKEETSKNKNWHQIALEYVAIRKQEFDNLDPSGTTPVFLTSEVLYKVLLNLDEEQHKASQLYNSPELLPIPAISNLLGRPLIPLYRHWNYNLKKWPQYTKILQTLF